MILEKETFEAFGYYPSKLKPHSNKSILTACELCGKFRTTTKNDYHHVYASCANRCRIITEEWKANISAAHKGMHQTEEAKAKNSAAHKGNTYALGYKHTEEAKARMKGNTYALGSTRTKEQKAKVSGENHHNYNGGEKVVWKRKQAKRKRQLGYTLLMPLKEGEVGHHVTNEYVIGIPTKVHLKLTGGGRKKHRTLILQWLKVNDKKKYKTVLCVLAKELSK